MIMSRWSIELLVIPWMMAAQPSVPAAVRPDLVTNGGFEELAPDGRPTGWTLPRGYAIVDERPASGARCLHYSTTDTGRYLLASSPISLEPGSQYELTAKIRTRNVAGPESGAAVCIEWQDAGGRHLGGCYPRGIAGTHADWTEIRAVTTPIPTNAARASVKCYLRRGITGEAWWDDVSVRLWRPLLVGTLATDHYRDQFTGGVVRVFASHALPAHRLDPIDAGLELVVVGADGRELARVRPAAVADDHAVFQLDTTGWPTGGVELVVGGRDSFGEMVKRKLPAVRLASPPPNRRTWFDAHRRLIVNGEPFFPLGMYWGSVNAEQIALYARSPFNCLMPYPDIGRSGLDLAWSNGIRVIYSVKDLYDGHRGLRSRTEADEAVRRTVKSLCDHPAIIAWYINDEFPLSRFDELRDRHRLMAELDPGRPTWSVLYQISELRDYLPTCDAIGTDPYPIPFQRPSKALDWAQRSRAATFGVRPIWMVPQVFNWAAYKTNPDELARCRAPTLQEMRVMAWSCIAAGADGLIFYSWFDLWRMDAARAKSGQPVSRDPFEERWRDIVTMASEIRDFIPVLLSTDPPPAMEITGESAEAAARVFRHQNLIYALAVNASTQETARLTFRGNGSRHVVRNILGATPPTGPWDGNVELPPLSVALFELGE